MATLLPLYAICNLPRHKLLELGNIRGDVHMHTVETDGRNIIEEMAEAARSDGQRSSLISRSPRTLAECATERGA